MTMCVTANTCKLKNCLIDLKWNEPGKSLILFFCHMASLMCGQDKPNSALRLANRAGRMALCRAVSCKKRVLERHERNHLLTKLVRSRLLDIGVLFFCEFMDPDVASIQPSWPHTLPITLIYKTFWRSEQIEPDVSYSSLQKNGMKDLSALLTKVYWWLFITKSAFALRSRRNLRLYKGKTCSLSTISHFKSCSLFFEIFSDVQREKKTYVCHIDFLFISISKESKSASWSVGCKNQF